MTDDLTASPDPIDDPQAYQQYLLALLGDDDPATVQAQAPSAWVSVVEAAGDQLHVAPEPGEWSVFGCLAHAADAEIVMSARYRFIVSHDEPSIVGYDQDLWVDRLHADPAAEAPDELLTLFEALRVANVAMWLRSSDAERERVGIHAERGPESFDLSFRMIAGHDRCHVRQAREALVATNGSG